MHSTIIFYNFIVYKIRLDFFMIQKYCFLIVSYFLAFQANAQSFNNAQLFSKSFESLEIIYDLNVNDSTYAKQIASSYLNKSIQDIDSLKIANGYSMLAYVSKFPLVIKYLDSSISFSSESKSKNFPAQFYLDKSQYFFNNNEYERSLISAISAYNNATIKNNLEQQISALHQINLVNELWGDYRKVLDTELYVEKLISRNNRNKNYYTQSLFTLEGIGKCYVRLKKPDSALIYFNKGIEKTLKKKDTSTYFAFVSRTGMALTMKGKYKQALDSLYKGDISRSSFNNSYLPYFYYYVGKCYYNLEEKNKGIAYFKKIDSIYESNHILSPELPDVYDKLISYYKKNKEEELQLKYLYKLIQIERIIDVKRTHIKEKTNKDYHIPQILQEKEKIITDLSIQNKNSAKLKWWILSLLFISILCLFYYINRQRKFKKRFNNIINQQEAIKRKTVKDSSLNGGISITIIEEILSQLDLFEHDKNYLKLNISLNEIAKKFGTNSTYLSKVINLKKDKNFSQYINDLRIGYAIEQFEVNPKFRKYTIKAIAGECGFKNAESFSKAFYKKWGIYPSYYLKELDNKNN
jgi:AraC-like DNA-binding protein